MVDHGTAVATREENKVGRPEIITPVQAEKYIQLVRRGLSDDMAAGYVQRSGPGMRDYCNRHPKFAQRLGEAKAHKTMYHMKNLDRISRTRDTRGYNAAVKASEAMLRANDPRFRKDPDAMTPGVGGGVTIIVKTGNETPSGLGFAGSGGVIDAEAVEVLESRADLGVDAVTDQPELADLMDPEPQEQPGDEAAVVAEIQGGGDRSGANEASSGETNDTQTYF